MKQVKADRAARRQIEIELQIPRVHATVHYTSKRDTSTRKRIANTLRLHNYKPAD